MSRLQRYDLASQVRLEVETDPPAGTLLNLLENHSGFMGGHQWVSTGYTSLVGNASGTFSMSKVNGTTDGPNAFNCDYQPVTPGQYVNASWLCTQVKSYYKVRLQFADSNRQPVGSFTPTGYLTASATRQSYASIQVPAAAVYVRIKVNIYATSSGTGSGDSDASTSDMTATFTQFMLATGPTSASVANPAFTATTTIWSNIITSASSLSIARDRLSPGSLSATVLSTVLDPAVSTSLRPGRDVRVTALDSSDGVWKPLFTGTLTDADVDYDPRRVTSRSTMITLQATDAVARLATRRRPNGAGNGTASIGIVMEATGVAYMYLGNWGQAAQGNNGTPLAVSGPPSALDQLVLSRDTSPGTPTLMFVDRNNYLQIWFSQVGNAGTFVPTLDETTYSDLQVSFATDVVVNEVTVVALESGASATAIETTYGPYDNGPSIAKWGLRPAEFRGIILGSQVPAFAAAVLAANGDPAVGPRSARIPIRAPGDQTISKAFLDLYSRVKVVNAARSINATYQVTTISHSIDASSGGWLMDLTFEPTGSYNLPLNT